MKKLFLVPAFLAALALPALAGGSATPNKVTITPLPATDTATAAATVTTAPDTALKQSKVKGGHGCGGAKTTAYIN